MCYKDENVSFWTWDIKLTSLSFDFWKLFLGVFIKGNNLISNVQPLWHWGTQRGGGRVGGGRRSEMNPQVCPQRASRNSYDRWLGGQWGRWGRKALAHRTVLLGHQYQKARKSPWQPDDTRSGGFQLPTHNCEAQSMRPKTDPC